MSSGFVVPYNIYFSEENTYYRQNHEFMIDLHYLMSIPINVVEKGFLNYLKKISISWQKSLELLISTVEILPFKSVCCGLHFEQLFQ